MDLVNRIFLTVLLLSIRRCRAEPPKIQLENKDGNLTINEGEHLSVSCLGDKETEWKLPDRFNSCYSPQRQNGPRNIFERKAEHRNLTGNGTYVNVLTIANVSYLDTGFVECKTYFLMPCKWTETVCILPEDTQDDHNRSPFLYVTSYSVIPCKPTSESYNLTVKHGISSSSYMDVHFNPFEGFQLMNASANLDDELVTCLATNGEEKDWCFYKLLPKLAEPTNQPCHVSFTSNPLSLTKYSNLTITCMVVCAFRPPSSSRLTLSHESENLTANGSWQRDGASWYKKADAFLENVTELNNGIYNCHFSVDGNNNNTSSTNLSITVTDVSSEKISHDLIQYSQPVLQDSINIVGLIVGISASFACIVGVLLFAMFRLRRSNRIAKLKALHKQYFSESDKSLVHPTPVVSGPSSDESSNNQHVRMASIDSTSTNSTSLTEYLEPSTPASTSQASTLETNVSTSWLVDSLGQLPYNRSLFEIDPKLLTFNFSHRLGSGFFGVVIKGELTKKTANNSSIQKVPVAVKCIKDSVDYQQYNSLTREIKLLSLLGRHLNVVNLEGAITCRLPYDELYMVLEFCPGGDLTKFLLKHKDRFRPTVDYDCFTRQGDHQSASSSMLSSDSADVAVNSTYLMVPDTDPQNVLLRPLLSNEHENGSRFTEFDREFLTIRDLVIFSYQVASGMEFLHARKCLHRDLAARNVLVSNGNVLKITDFGLAKDLGNYDGIYNGKTARPMPYKWLAPECLRFQEFKPESDIWSYGVLLWEIFTLCENQPYAELSNRSEVLSFLIAGKRLEFPTLVPGDICAVANACWDILPTFRPNFSTLKAELARKLPEEIVRYYKGGGKSSLSTRRNVVQVSGISNLPILVEETNLT